MARTPKPVGASSGANVVGPRDGRTLSFEYIKSALFRVIHADGAIAAVTPAGNAHLAFYSERPAIPNITVHDHLDDGTVSSPKSVEKNSKANYMREIDVDIVFDADVAQALILFLQDYIKSIEEPAPRNAAAKRGRRVRS